ncbi:hypothetical protein HMPREF0682_0831 [Propionibacterium acidifaciens F0233]|uniref:Uncharacterized protein n=1 Tax=Propionibacterium acidifaciens F0233 TaxID=553198 RepID=U2RYC2_9ACTN|nr:hypothetical protein HMPREF0682_0831 [Propionibacterium acidifaciens F0233]
MRAAWLSGVRAGSRDEPQNERSAAGLPEELEQVYDTPVVEQSFERSGRFKPRRPARPRGRVLADGFSRAGG